MEWFILSRDLHVLCVPSSDSKDSLPIFNDKQTIVLQNNTVVSTYDFSVQQKHPDATNLKYGNYIVFRDKYGKARMYTLISHDGDDLTQTWHAEDIGLDLLNETADKWDYTGESHGIDWYFNNLVLKDTGWSIGINEISNLTRGLKFDGQSDTQLKRLGDIANQFDGAEIDFEVELDGSRVTKQVINIYRKVGNSMTQQRFIDAVNLKSLQSSGSIEDLCTAMIGYGSQPDIKDGENAEDVPPIDFADLSYDDGQFFSPKGDKAVYDRLNHLVWSRYSGFDTTNQNETKGYITGIYNYETKDPNELLNRTITQLKKRNAPSETYEANLLDINADIGDEVQIAHNNYNPPIYLSARVESVTNCYTASGQDTGILGDYQKLESQIDPRIKEMIDQLADQIKPNYTWIRYAKDDKGTGMTATPTADTKYVAIVSNKPTGVPSDDPADYAGHWQLIQGQDGKDGIPGATGADGKTSYTHFAYANNVSGTADFSLDNPSGRSYMGVYSDFTKADSTNPDDYIWSLTKGSDGKDGVQGLQGADGKDGIPGKAGTDGKTSYTHIAYANSADGKKDFSESPDNHSYVGMYVDFIKEDSNDSDKYGWSLIKGEDGLDGTPGKDGVAGKDGVGIESTQIMYAQSTSGTTAPTTGWTAQVPTLIKGQYLWTQTTWLYTDSTGEAGYTVSYNAKDGNTGANGVAGKDGVGIKSTVIEYAVSSNGVTKPSTGWSASIPTVVPGQFLWTRTTWSYTDSTNEVGYSVAQAGATGPKGDKGNSGTDGVAGKDGIGVKSTAITYALGDSGTAAPTTSWTTSVPSLVKGKYLWTKTVWLYTDNTSESGYSTTYIGKDGNDGNNGVAGKDGVGISATKIEYVGSTSGTNKPTNGWLTTVPSVAAGSFLWTKTTWSYTDGTSESGYSVAKMGEKGPQGPQGLQGLQGTTGNQGIQGPKGLDGKSSYTHIAYGTSNSGAGFTQTPSASTTYIGMYVDQTATDSTDPNKYAWSLIKGADGAQGTPGAKGADGKTPYFHSAWANSVDGKTGFSTTDSVNKSYLGTYTDFTVADSADPTKYAWSLIKGADGVNGKDGVAGKAGTDGRTPYFHTAWADSADGKINFSLTDATNRGYLGTYTDFVQADSTDTTKYAWSLIKGRDGSNGAPGKAGTDGKTPYFHQAWADSKDGKINFSTTDPTNRGYLGTYSDFTQADSTDPSKYFWTELVGNLQVGGRNYFLNSDFSQAETNWEDTNSVWFISGEKCNGQKVMTVTPTVAWMSGSTNSFSQTMSTITNQQVTVSVWAKASKSGAKFHSEPFGGYGAFNTSLTNTWKRYSYVAQTNTNGTIFFMAVDVGTQYWISMPQVEIGNKVTDWSPAPEDTQGQIDKVNNGLEHVEGLYNSILTPVASITAPPNPKEGQGWWVLNANQQMIGFKIYKNGAWGDAQIQQSAMNIGTLNGNIINGATINTSDFNMSFDQTNAIDGANKKGVTTIENGEIRTDFQIKSTKQTGYVHLTPEGLSTGSTKLDGTEQNSVSLAFGQIDLATTAGTPSGGTRLVRGSLNAEDMEKSGTTYWESGGAGDRQKFWAYKQFRRVVLTGVIVLPQANFGTGGNGYRTIFNITDTSLRPLTVRWVKCSSFGSVPHLGVLEFRPNGDVVAIGVPSPERYSFEGESYAIENL